MRLNIPSCILAPPDAQTIRIGKFSNVALSIILVIFSPTTEPMDPPMNLKSIKANAKGIELTEQIPVTTPSLKPVPA